MRMRRRKLTCCPDYGEVQLAVVHVLPIANNRKKKNLRC